MKKSASLSEILNESQIKELENSEIIINSFNTRFNLLSYFEKIFSENVWTRIFAFLLSSEEKHGLGCSTFEYWLDQICLERNDLSLLFRSKLSEKPAKIFTKTEWTTSQGRRVDLILELNDNDGNVIGVIGIENKLDSNEQEEQLSDYQKSIHESFPNIPTIMLYCTPDGRQSKTALKNFPACPYFRIDYSSFKNVFEYFSNLTNGELELIFKSTYQYLEQMIAKERKREILATTYDPSLPFNERNKYSSLMKFFNDLYDYFKANRKFPFVKASLGTFSTNEIKIFVDDLRKPKLVPSYILHSSSKQPRIGDYFVVRLMIHSKKIHKIKVKEKQPILNDILNFMQLPNSRNEPKHWDPWINIWTSNKYQLVDLGETDIKNMLKLVEESMDMTYSQLNKKFNEYVNMRPDIAF